MKYYKIILNNTFIGVVNPSSFVAENPISKRLLIVGISDAQYMIYKGILYRDYWMVPIVDQNRDFIIATITEITEQEYNALQEAINNNEEIEVEDDEEEEVTPELPDEATINETIEFMRNSKLNEMSYTCRRTIENGFDLELRGETHHFSLDTQDQLNLISLSAMAQTQSLIPYHADGEMCIFYTAEEMNEIVATATAFKVYHTTYYNALKGYINSLETIEDIAAIEYGTPIPEEFKSDVLKALEQ